MQLGKGATSTAASHLVQFYDDDARLEAAVLPYLGDALRSGKAAIAIATRSHLDAIAAGMSAAGVDVRAAVADGRCVLLDAATTLAQILDGTTPDDRRFDHLVGGAVRRAARDGRDVRAFGEMVALLWARGDVAAAVELERLWNRLAEAVSFGILCAYPSWLMEPPDVMAAYAEVCAAHDGVVAGAPAPPSAELCCTFPRSRHAPSRARHFVAESLRSWGLEHLIEDGLIVVTELASNAVVHAQSSFTVALSRRASAVRITVGDVANTVPTPPDPDTHVEGGRGLELVVGVGSQWGVTAHPLGKLVWADVGCGPAWGDDWADAVR